MAHKTLILLLVFLMSLPILDVKAAASEEIKELQAEIMIYNLVNGLYLDKNQKEFIVSCAKEIKKKDDLDTEQQKDLKYQAELLRDLKGEVRENKAQVSPYIAKGIHENKLRIKRLRKDYMDAVKSKAQAVKAMLNENQLYTIEHFKPCLVPPKWSARIGQDDSGAAKVKFLERIHQMPEDIYRARRSDIAYRQSERLRLKFLHFKEAEFKQAEDDILSLMDKIRAMSPADFMIEKGNLAKQAKEIISPPRKIDIDKKIIKFLLGAQTISILAENPT